MLTVWHKDNLGAQRLKELFVGGHFPPFVMPPLKRGLRHATAGVPVDSSLQIPYI
jgi:hypothetical protein